jgi:hypothetical protein
MEITSVFVLMDLMVQNVKVTKTQYSCFIMFILQIKFIVLSMWFVARILM